MKPWSLALWLLGLPVAAVAGWMLWANGGQWLGLATVAPELRFALSMAPLILWALVPVVFWRRFLRNSATESPTLKTNRRAVAAFLAKRGLKGERGRNSVPFFLVAGPPGSGKSTLAHLIPRFYDVSSGRITIDGQDIRDVTVDSLRRAAGVVQQDAFLFTTTIENNVAYGDPWAEEHRIERAAESAQLHDYIVGLPSGYETVVGERGASLSGGQRQRLTIARSLMLHQNVLVLDDSTAAVDAATEQRIRSALRVHAADRVTIVISHRLSSLMHADQILFIEDGRVVERGTHDALVAAGGRYRALYDLQLRPAEDALQGAAE